METRFPTTPQPELLLVDDEVTNLQLLRQILAPHYRLRFARNGTEALQRVAESVPDLVILDVMMPEMNGFEVARRIRSNPETRHLPILFCTALGDPIHETEGFTAGGVDYLTKPISPPVLLARVRTHLSLVARDELERTRLAIIQRLGRAAEYKDNETGRHVIRMSHFSRLIAEALGAPREWSEQLFAAAPMHDIGKIGIPDHILLKPGKLDADEWRVMRTHPEIGAAIIGEDPSSLLQMARRIALEHHEKWDGSGYPYGKQGETISIEARIVAVADVFDALTSARPYKPAWSIDRAVALLREESGRHFWPEAVTAFLDNLDAAQEIQNQWRNEVDVENPMEA